MSASASASTSMTTSISTAAPLSIDSAHLARLKQYTEKIAANPTPEEFLSSHTHEAIIEFINDVKAAEEMFKNISPDHVSLATKEFERVILNLKFQIEMGKQLREEWVGNVTKLRRKVTGEIDEKGKEKEVLN
jgi:hypothetical protein